MRKGTAKKRILLPDAKYNDVMVTRFVNNMMWSGKKNTAFYIFYDALDMVEAKTQERGIDVKEKHPRVSVTRQDIAMEIDILAVDTTDVVLVECKSRLSKDDVDEFIEKLQNFKVAFPAYKDYQAYGAVAGIEINQGIDRYAYQQGLFVIRPSGETVEIVNDQKFQAKIW